MKAVTFTLTLQEPLLTTQTASGEPNSATAYPFIPGSMIRGALINRYLAGKTIDLVEAEIADSTKCQDSSEGKKKVHSLFWDGTVCYLNAYLAHPNNQTRFLPKPYSWFVPKDKVDNSQADIFDFACQVQTGEAYKPPETGHFVRLSGDQVELFSTTMVSFVHNTSQDPNRKGKENSQVYRYQAIATGQTFAGAITSDDDFLLGFVKDLLNRGNLTLGGSQTGGYGHVLVSDVTIDNDWCEFEPLSNRSQEEYQDEAEDDFEQQPTKPQYAIITCLSDLIWRDKQGQVNDHLVTPSGKKPVNAYYQMRVVGGFNRTWGLPLCQSWAIQAGSVFVFPPECYNELQTWVTNGVGERRVEGFGRVALNWHTQKIITQGEGEIKSPFLTNNSLSKESQQLAQQMANRQLQIEVERKLVERIGGLNQFQGLPKAVHLSRARLAAKRAWHKRDVQEIANYFANLSPTAIKQWERAKLNRQSFKQWILEQVQQVDQFTLVTEMPIVAGVPAVFEPIQEETLARLIEGVLRRAVKVAKARDEGDEDGTVAQ